MFAHAVSGRQAPTVNDNIRTLVSRLDLKRYKSTIESLSDFGDRRQGTRRNRNAVDWIEAQLKSYGCADVERLTYTYVTAQDANRDSTPTSPIDALKGSGPGGATVFGRGRRPTVNRDLLKQPDPRIREMNREEPADGERQEVYCTKIGTTQPDEMYILGGHLDGHGVNQGSNDDASGTALVMELARILADPNVRTDRSVRFVLWNNEETGHQGAAAYVAQRASLQGVENPAGSHRYPEPRWLGMIEHDMMLFDHGAPGPDGRVSPNQRREADVNIEFQSKSAKASESMTLALLFKAANEAYATNYPAAVGPHMTNTDSNDFMDRVASISLREAERGSEIGGGWDPLGHTPGDVFTAYKDEDFRLGLNAAQTTLGAIAQLVGARLAP
jgi:acetylornithine deacetylase/succinyl-diaminopimelate desuccinylase-like protein